MTSAFSKPSFRFSGRTVFTAAQSDAQWKKRVLDEEKSNAKGEATIASILAHDNTSRPSSKAFSKDFISKNIHRIQKMAANSHERNESATKSRRRPDSASSAKPGPSNVSELRQHIFRPSEGRPPLPASRGGNSVSTAASRNSSAASSYRSGRSWISLSEASNNDLQSQKGIAPSETSSAAGFRQRAQSASAASRRSRGSSLRSGSQLPPRLEIPPATPSSCSSSQRSGSSYYSDYSYSSAGSGSKSFYSSSSCSCSEYSYSTVSSCTTCMQRKARGMQGRRAGSAGSSRRSLGSGRSYQTSSTQDSKLGMLEETLAREKLKRMAAESELAHLRNLVAKQQ